jgi:hypothetical protein
VKAQVSRWFPCLGLRSARRAARHRDLRVT